jgi:hypothetical protein
MVVMPEAVPAMAPARARPDMNHAAAHEPQAGEAA